MKMFSLDVSRFEKFHSELAFITERVTETLGNLYAMHWPYKQHTTSRNIRLLPYHNYLKARVLVLDNLQHMRDLCGIHLMSKMLNTNIVMDIKIGMSQQNTKQLTQEKT